MKPTDNFMPLALLLTSGIFVLPAGADPPAPPAPPAPAAQGSVVNARELGVTEAMLHFCAKADPAAGARLKEKVKLLVQGASIETLEQVRRSEVYHEAHRSMDAFIAKIDEHNFKRFCAESPADTP